MTPASVFGDWFSKPGGSHPYHGILCSSDKSMRKLSLLWNDRQDTWLRTKSKLQDRLSSVLPLWKEGVIRTYTHICLYLHRTTGQLNKKLLRVGYKRQGISRVGQNSGRGNNTPKHTSIKVFCFHVFSLTLLPTLFWALFPLLWGQIMRLQTSYLSLPEVTDLRARVI